MKTVDTVIFKHLAWLLQLGLVLFFLNSCESNIEVTRAGFLPGANGTAEAPTFSLSAGSYKSGTKLELTTKTLEGEIYYTTDGDTPTEQSAKYTTPITLLTSQTIKALTVKTKIRPSTVVTAEFVIVPVENGAVSEPVATPAERTFNNTVSVTLSAIPLAATIYYSTDGSTPSILYTGAIELTRGTRLKAKASLAGYTASTVMDQTFTFKVADPVFSIPQGTYGPSQTVSMSSTTAGATVHYTTDGSSEPTCSSASGALTVSQSMTVKAVGCKDGYTNSGVVQATYTINGSVAKPTFSVSQGSYGPNQTVALSTTTPDAIIYYTTDGIDPTILSSRYSSPITVASTTTIKAFAVKVNFINSTVASATYTIIEAVAKPVATPPGGTFNNDVTVTLTTIPAQASIVYSRDSTTINTPYSAALNISATTTLRAKASMSNYTDSEPLTEVYTLVVASPVFSVQDSATHTVQISTITSSATIYYTLDGSDPFDGTNFSPAALPYVSAVSVPNGQPLKAMAVRSGYTSSAVVPFVDDGKIYLNGALANGYVTDKTALLLHMDGEEASTTFTDSSSLGQVINPIGNANISTSQSKFGGASGYFNGASELRVPSNLTEIPSGMDFTIEAWIYPTSSDQFGILGSVDYDALNFAVSVGALGLDRSNHGGGEYASGAITTNVWQHVAAVRSGNTARVFVDGVLRSEFDFPYAFSAPSSLGIGHLAGESGWWANGYIDEVRITKGLARYTSNFTPPSAAFEPSDGCYVAGLRTNDIVNGSGYCTGDHSYYIAGSAKPGLNSSGTGLSTSDNEYYVNGTRANGFYDNACYDQGINTGGVLNGTGFCTSDGVYYVDGVARPGLSASGTGINTVNGKYYVNGVIFSGVRQVITPSLLLHMDTIGSPTDIVDSSPTPKTISTNGDAVLTSSERKFGSSSLFVPSGNNSAIMIPGGSHFNFGSGNFTVEFWIKSNGIPQYCGRVFQTTDGDNLTGFGVGNLCEYQENLGVSLWNGEGGGWSYSGPNPSISYDQNWHHFALVRDGDEVKIFKDGNMESSVTFPGPLADSSAIAVIGGNALQDGSRSINAFIDEFRVVKGFAVYTSNFTPPIAAFEPPDGSEGCYVAGVKTNDIVNGSGYCSGDQTYYIAGAAKPGLNSSGTGLSTSDNKYYVNGSRANGFYDNACYVEGLSASSVVNGTGYCVANNTYYIDSVAQPGLDSSGSGYNTANNKYYVNGSLASGYAASDKTALLLHMDGSDGSTTFSDSSASHNTLVSQASTTLSTVQSKFGITSMVTNDAGWITSDSPAITPNGSEDFTVEMWIRFKSSPSWRVLLTSVNRTQGAFQIGFNENTALVGPLDVGWDLQVPHTMTFDNTQWHHFAVARSEGTLRVYQDGSLIGQTNSPSNYNSSDGLSLGGAYWAGPQSIDVYMDEVRITKGLARYNDNFTPPSAAFESSGIPDGCYVAGVKTNDIINGSGYCTADQTYYIAGYAMPGLNSSGTGLSTSDNKYYANATLASGFYDNACYDQGINTGGVLNGTGFCSSDGLYYVGGVVRPGLDSSGTGINANDGKYYVNGVLANGLYGPLTALLIHMDGANGSASFVDSSANALNVTPQGNVQVATNESQFGGSSAYFDGSPSYLTIADSSALGLGTADFTIEMFVKTQDFGRRNSIISLGRYDSGILWRLTPWIPDALYLSSDSSSVQSWDWDASGISVPENQWSHIALTRKAGQLRAFVNGAISFQQDIGIIDLGTSKDLTIGVGAHEISYIDSFVGYIDELRITKGAALYLANFTPPTEPFTPSTQNCYAAGVKTNNIVNGSGYCAGDQTYYIAGAAKPGLNSSGTGLSTSDNKYYVNAIRASGFYDNACYVQGMNTGGVVNGTGYCIADGKYYVQGIEQPGLDSSGSGINANDGKYYVNGSIASGYVASKTVLLLHMDGSDNSTVITDSARGRSATVNGDAARISTAQSKFGGSSVYFDGSSGIQIDRAVDLAFGGAAQDFTVEMWLHPTANHSYNVFFDARAPGSVGTPGFGISSANNSSTAFEDGIAFYDEIYGASNPSTSGIALNTWSHFALVRSGTTVTYYINGVASGSQTFTFSGDAQNPSLNEGYIRLGAIKDGYNNPYNYIGYMDEVRITKGLARYTSNFTPSSVAFDSSDSSEGCYVAGVKTNDVVNGSGYCSGDQTYYIAGAAKPGLNSSGTGLSTSDNKYYVNAALASGFYDNACYIQGVNTGGVVNGTGYCRSASGYIPQYNSYYGSGASNAVQVTDPINIGFNEDFTIDFWFYELDGDTSVNQPQILNIGSNNFGVYLHDNIRNTFIAGAAGYFTEGWYGGGFPAKNIWHHLAVSRESGALRLFLDGDLKEESSFSESIAGKVTLGGFDFAGFIDKLRITKGLARYTSTFAPPSVEFESTDSSEGCYVAGVKTIDVVNGSGYCVGDQTYYIKRSGMPGLNSSGTGLSTSDNKYYVNAARASGLYDNACYAQGMNTGDVVNGTGYCLGDGKYYVNGSLANGLVLDNPVLLLHMNGTEGSTSFKDSTTKDLTGNVGGDAKITNTQSKFGNGSAYFDGSDDYISFTSQDDFVFGTGDFTAELWFMPQDHWNDVHTLITTADPNDYQGFLMGTWYNLSLRYYVGDATDWIQNRLSAEYSLSAGSWYHLAVSRKNGTTRTFLNGGLVDSFEDTNNYTNTNNAISIGGRSFINQSFVGWIDEVRITKGKARYTTDFTPASEEYAVYQCFTSGVSDECTYQDLGCASDGFCAANSIFYSNGSPASAYSQDTCYIDGSRYSGFMTSGECPSACYSNGRNTGGIVNGTGYCSTSNTYYIASTAYSCLDFTGTGTCGSSYYENGLVKNPQNVTRYSIPGDVDNSVADETASAGNFVWLAYRYNSNIQKRDIMTGALVSSISLPGNPGSPLLLKSGNYIWAFSGTQVWRIHRTTNAVTTLSPMSATVYGGWSSDGYIWLSTLDGSTPKLIKLNGTSGATENTVDLSGFFTDGVYGISGDASKIALTRDNKLVFFDKGTLGVLRTVNLPDTGDFQSGLLWMLIKAGDGWFMGGGGGRLYRYDYQTDAGTFLDVTINSIEGWEVDATGFWITSTHSTDQGYLYHVKFDGTVDRRVALQTLYGIAGSYAKVQVAPGGKVWISHYYSQTLLILNWLAN